MSNLIKQQMIILPGAFILILGVSIVAIIAGSSEIKIVIFSIISIAILFILFVTKQWLPILILSIPIREVSLGEIGPAYIRGGDLILLLILIFWIINLSLRKGVRFRLIRNKLDIAIMLFLMLNALSILWAPDPSMAIVRSLKFIRDGIFYLLIREALFENFERNIKQLTFSLILTGVFVSFTFLYFIAERGLSAIQYMLREEIVVSQSCALSVVRGEGLSGGIFLGGVGLWVLLCFFMSIGTIPQIGEGVLIKILVIIIILTFLGVILISAHRGAWLALAGGIITYGFAIFKDLRSKRKIFIFFLIVFVALSIHVLNFTPFLYHRLSYSTLSEDAGIKQRFAMWQTVLNSFKQSPLIGVGTGGIKSVSEYSLTAHSLYLQILGELGIVGFTVFIWLVALWISYLLEMIKKVPESNYLKLKDKVFLASILGGSVAYLIYGIVGQDFESMEPWILLSMSSALFTIRKYTLSHLAVQAERGRK